MKAGSQHPATIYLGVVDDNTFLREWLGQGATLSPHQHVVARAQDAATMTAQLFELSGERCDVILLDLRTYPSAAVTQVPKSPAITSGLADSNPDDAIQGVNAVELLLSSAAEMVGNGTLHSLPAILVYTQEPAAFVHVKCLAAGASGVVSKDDTIKSLTDAIDTVAAGGVVITPDMAELMTLLADQTQVSLTEAEAAALTLHAHGYDRRHVAKELSITEDTVDKHFRSIRQKFGRSVNFTDLADAHGLRDLNVGAEAATRPRRAWITGILRRSR